MDNNGQILYHAKSGISRGDLEREGIPVSDSQIELLKLVGALDIEGDVLTTAFPLIGPEQLSRIRPWLRQRAVALAPNIEADVATIRARLGEQGLPHSEFAVVFGHAVDGLLWERLRARDALPSTVLTRESPLWRGAFWALYPTRGNVAGVNELRVDHTALVLTWTQATGPALRGINTSAAMREALPLIASGRDVAPIVDTEGRRWDLSADGRAQVPIIRERMDDPLHASALRIAQTLADALTAKGRMAEILSSIDGADRKQAMVIVAHEFIWDVMEVMVERGSLKRPSVLDDADAGTDELRALLFVRIS